MGTRKNKSGGKQKRQPKVRGRDIGRRPPTRSEKPSILIVCEDSKSSYIYFHKLRQKHRLSTVKVKVCGPECGNAPINVVDCAISEKEKAETTSTISKGYDHIFCVIDKDTHDTLDRAIEKTNSNGLKIILSNPCFEYWYILHFKNTSKAYNSSKAVVSELKKKHHKGYTKGSDGIFDIIYDDTDKAIANSKHVLKSQWQGEEDLRNCNPSTHVHVVVECIRGIGGR